MKGSVAINERELSTWVARLTDAGVIVISHLIATYFRADVTLAHVLTSVATLLAVVIFSIIADANGLYSSTLRSAPRRVEVALDKFNRDADFSTWLSSVARNYCIDHYRAGKREREVLVEDLVAFDLAPASSGNPHRALEDQDRRSFLRKGLDLLPDKLREAVVLRDLQGLSYQEMAERLALPEGTVKSRINRGREELARLLLRAQQPPRRGRARAVGRRGPEVR